MNEEREHVDDLVASCRLSEFTTGEDRAAGCLARIERVETVVQAFVAETLQLEKVAGELAAARAAGGRFAGVPFGVKEIAAVDGFPRRCGSRLPPEAFAAAEASLVTRLRRLGMVPIGLTVSTEFAYFDTGPTANPHNPDHTPGGSSSGSAAAVAAGMVPFAIGTQTIGSVIRPAAYCGIVGFKPTFGVLPRDGFLSFSRTVDHVGFFAQEVADIVAVSTALGALPGEAQPIGETRLAAVEGSYLEQVEPRARAAFEETVNHIRDAGFEVDRDDPFGPIEAINAPHRVICAREFHHAHAARFSEYGDRYQPASRSLYQEGGAIPVAEYDAALESRDAAVGRALDRDATRPTIWLSPAAPGPAPAGLSATGNPVMNLPWTFLGRPVVTIPAGRDTELGLPLGLQLSGPYLQERSLLAVAARLERALDAR